MSIAAEVQVPSIDTRVEFWSMRGARWPRNWHKHIFAGWVVHRTGRLIYREAWTGYETETVSISPLPVRHDSKTRPSELAFAINLLVLNYPPYSERHKEAIEARQNAPLPTIEEWQIAVGISKQISNDTYSAVQRFEQVVEVLVALLERGILRAALRPYFSGGPVELAATDWYNEIYHAWFATCQVDLSNPFSGIPVRTGGHWIVFEADSFEAWEASVSTSHPGACAAQTVEAGEQSTREESAASSEVSSTINGDTTDYESHSPKPTDLKHLTNDSTLDSITGGDASVEFPEAKTAKPATKRKKVGARPTYPWGDVNFEKHLLDLVRSEKPPRSMHELVDRMLEWCSCNWGREPGKTTATLKVVAILAAHHIEFP